jgi:sulfur-oxidizing protein SoxA
MARFLTVVLTLAPGLLLGIPVQAGPEDDRKAFLAHYQARFPDVPFAEYANGIYAIDQDARRQWQEIEEFPPYEFAVAEGEALWSEPLAGDVVYADCFPWPLEQIRGSYPRFDAERSEVVTLEVAINDCRQDHGSAPLAYDSEELISITAFLAFRARGQTLDTRIPGDQPGALAAYEAGKRFYYSKRGQLNFACADCHVTSAGQYVRADRLGPSLGHTTHFPVYRSKLGAMITLHQRFAGCVRDVRAKPFDLQSRVYRNLEYFLSYMSNGLELNGPGARK